LLAGLFVIALVTGVAAWMGPPNNWDSMTYHMVRVIHWIQNQNVAFYPTQSANQLELPPGAEYILLNLQLLFGGDRLANLAQWSAFVGCMVGASSIARLLGAGRSGQILAAVFTATLPSACLEAETTQSDLVAAFWLVCFIWLTLRIFTRREDESPRARWFLFCLAGISAGLSMATRATSYIHIAPFVLGLIGIAAAKFKWRAGAPLLVTAALAILLNLPIYVRNERFTHTLLGNPDNRLPYTNAQFGVRPTITNAVRNTALELILPWKFARMADAKTAVAILRLLGLNPDDPGSTWTHMTFTPTSLENLWWNNEDTAGNPAHLLLFLAAPIFLLSGFRRQGLRATAHENESTDLSPPLVFRGRVRALLPRTH